MSLKREETLMGAQSKATVRSSENVIITGDKVANTALHYASKNNTVSVRLSSKRDLRRQ